MPLQLIIYLSFIISIMNTYGRLYCITTFGESHGAAMWVIIDGLPAGFEIDFDNIRQELIRRKPGQSKITTARKEDDEMFEVLSGIFEGKSTGHPITIITRNKHHKSKDYDKLKDLYRPNHADYTYQQKYGIRDHRGGGRSSWRETLSRVIAWAIAKQYLKEKYGIEMYAFVKQIADIEIEAIDYQEIENNILRTANPDKAEAMIAYIQQIAEKWDSIGGIVECHTLGCPAGWGEPVFDKIKWRLAGSMLSIWGVLWFEYGAWFDTVDITWQSYNEWYINDHWKIKTEHNRYGGIQWWISTGEDIIFRVAVKPTSSIYSKQSTVNTIWETVDFQITWRHDPCILPRVVPVVEAMTAIDLLDLALLHQARK